MKKIFFTLMTVVLATIHSTAQDNTNSFEKWEIRLRALSVLLDEKPL